MEEEEEVEVEMVVVEVEVEEVGPSAHDLPHRRPLVAPRKAQMLLRTVETAEMANAVGVAVVGEESAVEVEAVVEMRPRHSSVTFAS